MESQNIINLRNLHPDGDMAKLLQLRAEIEAVDQHGNDLSEAHLRRQFAWPNHDPSRDRWVLSGYVGAS